MGKIARSARGVMVDFDLMKIKEQMANSPAPLEVKIRQDFIENRLKRRLKKAELPKVETTKVDSAPDMPAPAAAVDESHIEKADTAAEVEEKPVVKKSTTKQKARSNKNKKIEE